MERQEQAERSVLISCQSGVSEKRFLKFLSKHGDIKKYFFYESYVSKCSSVAPVLLRGDFSDWLLF